MIIEQISQSIVELFKNLIQILLTNSNEISWKFAGVAFLALIGFFALLYGAISQIGKGLSIMLKSLIYIPLIIIFSLVNKRKRKERMKHWIEIKDNFKGKDVKRSKWIIFLLLRIGLPLVVLLFIIF